MFRNRSVPADCIVMSIVPLKCVTSTGLDCVSFIPCIIPVLFCLIISYKGSGIFELITVTVHNFKLLVSLFYLIAVNQCTVFCFGIWKIFSINVLWCSYHAANF